MWNLNIQFVHFHLAANCGLGYVEVKCLFSSIFMQITFLKIWWSGFTSQWCIEWTKLWKPVSDLTFSNDTLVIAVSVAFFVILKYGICTLSSFIIESWDHRLNYKAPSFTTEIRITDEGTL